MGQRTEFDGEDVGVLLVCEDEDGFCPILNSLSAPTIESRPFRSVYRAVADFARRPAELAIIELNAFEETEFECIDVLKEMRPSLFVLLVVNQSNREKLVSGLQHGADAYLVQPFYPQELTALVGRWYERLQQSEDIEEYRQEQVVALAKLARGVARQVDEPLANIEARLDDLHGHDSTDDDQCALVSSAREGTEKIAALTRSLLAFGADASEEGCSVVDMHALLDEMIADVEDEREHFAVEKVLDARECAVWGNRKQLYVACRMILQDAADALEPGGSVRVQTRVEKPNRLRLSFHDEGRPLSPEQLENLFEPFGIEPRSETGTGLIYPAAYGIIVSHGGKIAVSSTAEQGTDFLVELPLISTVTPMR